MNYYKRWNPEKESNEFFNVWSEESFLEGKTIWRLWTEDGITWTLRTSGTSNTLYDVTNKE